MKIYIIRHGETDANKNGIIQGWQDDPLNEFGIELAVLSGQGMKGIHFDAAFTSPLRRAKKTAEIVLQESGNAHLLDQTATIHLQTDDRLKEMCLGDIEGKKFRPGEAEIDPAAIKQYFVDPFVLDPFPHGEHITDVIVRTQDFLKELATKPYESVLVATHGCAVRCMLNMFYEPGSNFWHGKVPPNCAVNIVDVDPVTHTMRLVEEDKVFFDPSYCIDRFSI